ncbi:L,D-transpeptidase family protein [Clostridium sp.]|uniref:L,D-transpeptidase family protein n=1 Tax=Clostridium sp. TaxID=1506 RepID=UPI002A7FA271|nr:L,D-transpeptidase family protein [Clostridium sp.]MDY4251688.1 hypothetical protein [Clostridium sp.]
MKNKKITMIFLPIIVIIFIIIFSISIYKSNNERKIINKIEAQISNGSYEEAIESINQYKNNEILILYKNILKDFLEIKNEGNIDKVKEKLDSFKEQYDKYLSNEIFNTLNGYILKIEDNIKNYYIEISEAKEKIEEAINEDISSAKEMIDKFKTKYPNENIFNIEDAYNKKLEQIKEDEEKIEEKIEEKTESTDKEKVSNNNNNSTSQIGISNTVASRKSGQIITVVSKGGSYGELVFWEKDSNDEWILVDKVSARLGQNGMKAASEVYEMDKSTPTGIYSLTEAFGINSDPGSKIRYRQLDGTEYWVDDVNSDYYNTMQFGEADGRWSSAEKLIEFEGYYNYSLVIDYNRWPVIPGKSSAIFLHCDLGSYTYGCVAIPQENLVNIINRLDPEKDPFIIIDFSYQDIYTKY